VRTANTTEQGETLFFDSVWHRPVDSRKRSGTLARRTEHERNGNGLGTVLKKKQDESNAAKYSGRDAWINRVIIDIVLFK
jgi:hypothetical protein